ncbi:MAG: PQQ-binding-like beta-propeller repeat protein, partial [Anaerolineales bacterium]
PHVYAVDLASGQEIWRFPAEPDRTASFYAPPLVTGGGLVIVGGYHRVIYALGAEDGRLACQYRGAGDRVIGAAALAGDLVLVPVADGTLHALRLSDGQMAWTFKAGAGLWSAPLVEGEQAFVASLDHHLYAIRLSDGQTVWDVDLGSALVDTPSLVGGLLLVGTFDQRLVAFEPGRSEPVWTMATEGRVWGNPAAADGQAYFGDVAGVLYAFDPATGRELWRFTQPNPVVPTPAVDDGRVFFVTQAGEVYARGVEDHAAIWQSSGDQAEILGRLLADPIVVGDLLLVGSMGGQSLLTAFDTATGQIRWSYTPAS